MRKTNRKGLRRKLKQVVYRFLVAVYEGEIRFSLFHIVCTVFILFLCVGFFFDTDKTKEMPTTTSVFGSELTHALHYAADAERHTELDADVTLFLLPDTEDDAALSSFLSAPLYGFYLTGKEVSYLPELYTSLSDSFIAGKPYIGGLSFSYNPNRLIYNRATDILHLAKDGSYSALSDDTLYYVIGDDSVFLMFHYLSERTFHLLDIQPKDAAGRIISDYSGQLLPGASGSHTLGEVYGNYLNSATVTYNHSSGEIIRCKSLNTVALFSQLNGAGFFLVGCTILSFTLIMFVRPSLRRIRIWFRLFLFRRKKKSKFSLRGRIYTARVARRNAA